MTYDLADVWEFIKTEIAVLKLKNRETLAQKRDTVISDSSENNEEGLTLFSTPLRPAEESQGDTIITLVHRFSLK